jgi:integrase
MGPASWAPSTPMSRPRKLDAPDLHSAIELTAGTIERLTCPAGKKQVFLRDSKTPGLRVRATSSGAKSFVYEAKLNRQNVRLTLGDTRSWSIEQARAEARRLAVIVDTGQDPRELARQRQAAAAAAQAEQAARALTAGEAWTAYVEDRRQFWGERNYLDHLKMAQPGGQERKRRPGVKTKAGPLFGLMSLRLVDLTAPRIEQWAAKEAPDRPARVRLALRLMKAFLRWAASEPSLKDKVDPNAASAKRAREIAGKPKLMMGSLQREQLQTWFHYVRQIPNPVISAYLQCTLLTGRRREEMAFVKWEDVEFQWNSIDMKDKWLGRSIIPLPPYMKHLLQGLPHRNEWVFSSPTSKSGRLREPSVAHRKACAAAGLSLTLHDLRRSFANLCEWLDIPGGISAQIQGHAPQGVREQNYIRRPLDLLRVHHKKIEAWVLKQAGVPLPRAAAKRPSKRPSPVVALEPYARREQA